MKFTGKHLCQSLFFNKDVGLACNFKKRPWHRCFPVTFPKFLGAPFFKEHLRWLLLFVEKSDLISCVEKEHEIMSYKGFAFQDFDSIEGVNSNKIIHGF